MIMHRYGWFVVAVALAATLSVGCAKSDKDKLQGSWVAIGMEGEKAASEDEVKKMDIKITFKDDKITGKGLGGQEEESTYSLDTGKKTITLNPPKDKKDEKAKTALYQFDGDDTLKLAMGKSGDAPKEFKASADTMIMTLKREKK